jgi:hypothetical protein
MKQPRMQYFYIILPNHMSKWYLGFAMPKRAWIWGLSVGIWIPIWNIVLYNKYSSIISIIIAFVGVYLGVLIYKLFFNSSD